jgi:hypothetical protein
VVAQKNFATADNQSWSQVRVRSQFVTIFKQVTEFMQSGKCGDLNPDLFLALISTVYFVTYSYVHYSILYM